MSDDLLSLRQETEAALAAAPDLRAWDAVRVATLGKQGKLTQLLKSLGAAGPEERRERGAALNRLKDELAAAIEARRAALEAAEIQARLAPAASSTRSAGPWRRWPPSSAPWASASARVSTSRPTGTTSAPSTSPP